MAVPDVTPVTTPVVKPTVATPVLLLLHVPTPVASDKGVVLPTHKERVPVIGAGVAFTVIIVDTEHALVPI